MPHPDLPPEQLAALGASHTAREIAGQPLAWRSTLSTLAAQSAALDAFLQPVLAIHGLRIVLTGAGTSAYIGECLVPELLRRLGRRVEAIATTELVSGPRDFLQREVPTLLVSFSRSGGSPESVAAVELADQCVARCFHLIITCNAAGVLHRRAQGKAGCYSLLLPEATHDQGFAMTASFTSMLLAARAVFCGLAACAARIDALARATDAVLATHGPRLRALATRDFGRVVFLGSGGLRSLAAEASLKLLELSDGAVVVAANSPLGFRHGPKAIVKRDTLVALFLSNDPLARRYDLDLLRELQRDAAAGALLVISARPLTDPGQAECLLVPGLESADDAELMLPYIVCAQLYALHRSLQLGLRPDTPCPSGAVNRIVQGVTIHPL